MIVWIASFPRSGNTFFRVILNSVFDVKTQSLYDDEFDIGADKETTEIVGHEPLPENFSLAEARSSDHVYYIKTHERLDHRVEDADKVVYLIRDGRECTYSLTRYLNTFIGRRKTITDTIYGNNFIGAWSDHVKSWNPGARPNTLLVKFEELTSDPVSHIDRISQFLGIKPVGEKIPSFEELKEINPRFFRSGKLKSWQSHFSDEEMAAFWIRNHSQMLDNGYTDEAPASVLDLDDSVLIREGLHQNNYIISYLLEQGRHYQKVNQDLNENVKHLYQELDEKSQAIARREKEIDRLNADILSKQRTIDAILVSGTYRLGYMLTYPYRKLSGKS